jgi:hypothetical protein
MIASKEGEEGERRSKERDRERERIYYIAVAIATSIATAIAIDTPPLLLASTNNCCYMLHVLT